MADIKTHIFMGKRYRIEMVSKSKLQDTESKNKGETCYGTCSPPEKKGKSIKIVKNQDEFDELDTFIHEAQHAVNWNNSEEFVKESSTDLAKFLWRLGYRRVK